MKKEIIKPRTLPGFMELLPQEQILFNSMKDTIRKSYEKFGFLPLNTPIIELSEILLAKAGGETEKQIYRFNKGENDLSLRFDLTVPLAKYVAMNYNELSFPFRRYQIGKVYRGEKPQKGRYREFYQCDIDIIGDGELSIINDAEIPNVIYETFKQLGFEDFTIYINNRKILNGLYEYLDLKEISTDIMRLIDKVDKIGTENLELSLKDLDISDEKINMILQFIQIVGSNKEKIEKLNSLGINNEVYNEGVKELQTVIKYAVKFGIPEEYLSIELKIARGLDYYTGTVYETILNDYKEIGSVCSGGRYDNLAGFYTDKKLPGVGISIGLTRLFYKLNEINAIKSEKKSISDLIIISVDDDLDKCLEVAYELRKNDINVEVYLENKKMKSKFKYIDKSNIPYIIIIGEDERKSNNLLLKDNNTREQYTMTIEEIIKKMKKNEKKC